MKEREKNEIMWQLHTIGMSLSDDYKLKHYSCYTYGDENTSCEKYVIEYNHRNKSDGNDST